MHDPTIKKGQSYNQLRELEKANLHGVKSSLYSSIAVGAALTAGAVSHIDQQNKQDALQNSEVPAISKEEQNHILLEDPSRPALATKKAQTLRQKLADIRSKIKPESETRAPAAIKKAEIVDIKTKQTLASLPTDSLSSKRAKVLRESANPKIVAQIQPIAEEKSEDSKKEAKRALRESSNNPSDEIKYDPAARAAAAAFVKEKLGQKKKKRSVQKQDWF